MHTIDAHVGAPLDRANTSMNYANIAPRQDAVNVLAWLRGAQPREWGKGARSPA
jgi:hypothetical protein